MNHSLLTADPEALNQILNQLVPEKIIKSVLVLIVSLIAIKIVLKIYDNFIQRTKVNRTLHSFIRSAVKITLLFITILIVVDTLGIKVTSLIALLSVAGLAISLAMQNSLSNLASGVVILMAKPFEKGHFIQIGSESGTVDNIGLFYTKLTTIDNKDVFIPNAQVTGVTIVNASSEEKRRVDLVFSASYNDDVELVKSTIRRVIDAHPYVLQDPEPFVRLSSYGASSIDYTVRVWTENAHVWDVHFDLLEQMKGAFDEAGISIPYPQMDVHFDAPAPSETLSPADRP